MDAGELGDRDRLDAAAEQPAAGREARALETLRGVLEEIRTLATEAHEASRGFHKLEWQRLVLDAEARAGAPVR